MQYSVADSGQWTVMYRRGKGKTVLVHCAITKPGCCADGCRASATLASALHAEEWSASRRGHFIPGEELQVPIGQET
jgi:hypothetical protein